MPEDVNEVMTMMKSRKWDISTIITHEFSIREIERAIQTAAVTDHAFNVIINFDV